MGDTVQIASRLQSITKTYNVNIIISGSTFDKIDTSFSTRELDNLKVRGQKQSLKVIELIN